MARIGDTVDPSLGRADTRGILMGAMAGAEAMGKGIAAAGQSLAEGMEVGRQRKVARKGTETKIQALMKLHEGNEAMTSRLAPLLNTLQSDEARGSEKDAIVSQIDPLVNAITAKQAQDVATAERNLANTYRAAQFGLQERQVKVAEKEAKAKQLTARAQLRKGGVGPFNELGYRFGNDGTIQYQSTGFEQADKDGVADLLARKDALATVDTDIQFLKDFRDKVDASTAGENVLAYITSKFGDAAATKYAEDFTSFSQDFAQRLAKARNGARVTDADVENAKKAIFNLAKSKTTNLQLIDRFTKELTDRKAEVERADTYLADNKVMIGYKGWKKGESLPGSQGELGTQSQSGPERTGPGSALGQLIEQEEQEAANPNQAPASMPAPPMGQGPGDSPETPVPDVEVEGRVPGPPASRLKQSRVQRALEQQEQSLEDAAQAVPVPAEPIAEEIDTSGAGLAEPTTQAVALTSSPASSAVALSNKIEGAALPKYSAKLVQNFTYDPSATEKIKPRFVPGLAERTKLRKAGNVLLNLDANHSGVKPGTKTPIRRVLEPIMVIPDDATPQAKTAAALAIGLMDNLFEKVHGRAPKASLESRLKTTSQNKSKENQGGRKGVIHSELFAVTDNKMVNFLKTEAGIKEYTGILREAFQDVPKLQIFLPHSQKDQGAATDKGSSEVSLALRTLKYL